MGLVLEVWTWVDYQDDSKIEPLKKEAAYGVSI